MDYKLDHDYAKYYEFGQNHVILDLGATLGEFGLIYRDKIAKNNILLVSVEPDLNSYNRMLDNYKKHKLPRTKSFNCGVWNENTELEFTTTDNPWCNMFDIHGHDISMIAGHLIKKKYPVRTLKSILDEIGHVNFLKADIEGAELEVFMSCENITDIDNFSIAAYHERNGELTWRTLKPFFESINYKVIVELIPYNGFSAYVMLYAERK